MNSAGFRKVIIALGAFLALWLLLRYCLPVLLPFLAGAGVALAAEPAVGFCEKKFRLPRGVAAGLGVGTTLILLTGVLSFAGALAVRELGELAGAMPDMEQTVQRSIQLLEDSLVHVASRLPEGIRPVATGTVLEMFDGSSALVGQLSRKMPGVLTSVLSWIPDSALGVGTGIIAGFMISARLPRLQRYFRSGLPEVWYQRYLPVLRQVRSALGGWLKAQLKLTLVTLCVLVVGFILLRIQPLWAVPVALVDALPMLGTGLVLLPWALVMFLQQKTVLGIGLLLLCAATMILRRILEPKLVGRQLELDPLTVLLFLYLGYRLWGFWGMILSPLLAAAVKTLATAERHP